MRKWSSSQTNNQKRKCFLTKTRTKPKLFCLFWIGIWEGSLSILHHTDKDLQWILYETPLENLSHIIFFYIISLNQGLMYLFIKWWKYYHRKRYDSELKIRRKPYQIPLVPLLNRGRSDRRYSCEGNWVTRPPPLIPCTGLRRGLKEINRELCAVCNHTASDRDLKMRALCSQHEYSKT